MWTSLICLILASESPSFPEMFDQMQPILFWVGGAIFVVFGVLLPTLIFAAAMLEKQHLAPLVLASEQGRRKVELPRVVEQAIAMNYQPLGLFAMAGGGKKKKLIFLMLAEDGQVLLRVWPGQRYQAMTRLHSAHWLITADTLPLRDLSGLEWEQVLPDTPLSTTLSYHRQRIGQANQPCAPFSAEDAPGALSEHEQQCVARLKELRLVRYVGSDETTWVFTFRGALKLAVQVARMMRTLREDKKRAETLKQRLETAPLKT